MSCAFKSDKTGGEIHCHSTEQTEGTKKRIIHKRLCCA